MSNLQGWGGSLRDGTEFPKSDISSSETQKEMVQLLFQMELSYILVGKVLLLKEPGSFKLGTSIIKFFNLREPGSSVMNFPVVVKATSSKVLRSLQRYLVPEMRASK